jgi:CheY-like chemotaxis protein
LSSHRSILVFDHSPESREVFRTALDRPGTTVLAASRPDEALALTRSHTPDLIVLDIELERYQTEASDAALREIGETALARHTPLVVLATARRQAERLPSGEFVAKPYHYGPLIRRIEELLEQ